MSVSEDISDLTCRDDWKDLSRTSEATTRKETYDVVDDGDGALASITLQTIRH